jgi:hypothetical protein
MRTCWNGRPRSSSQADATKLELMEQLATVEDRAARLESQLQSLRLDYAANVPPADFKPLLTLLQARVRAGVDRERLAFVIEQAGRERNCLAAWKPAGCRCARRSPPCWTMPWPSPIGGSR